jgi:hypothetical protein
MPPCPEQFSSRRALGREIKGKRGQLIDQPKGLDAADRTPAALDRELPQRDRLLKPAAIE